MVVQAMGMPNYLRISVERKEKRAKNGTLENINIEVYAQRERNWESGVQEIIENREMPMENIISWKRVTSMPYYTK